jgi:hypothetical protein
MNLDTRIRYRYNILNPTSSLNQGTNDDAELPGREMGAGAEHLKRALQKMHPRVDSGLKTVVDAVLKSESKPESKRSLSTDSRKSLRSESKRSNDSRGSLRTSLRSESKRLSQQIEIEDSQRKSQTRRLSIENGSPANSNRRASVKTTGAKTISAMPMPMPMPIPTGGNRGKRRSTFSGAKDAAIEAALRAGREVAAKGGMLKNFFFFFKKIELRFQHFFENIL